MLFKTMKFRPRLMSLLCIRLTVKARKSPLVLFILVDRGINMVLGKSLNL